MCQVQGPNKVFVECLMNCLPPPTSSGVHCWREACRFLIAVLCDLGQVTDFFEFSFHVCKMEGWLRI